MLASIAATEPDSAEAQLEVDRVYRDHFAFVWSNLRRFGVPRELLEDACHDVFVVVHRRASDFDPTRASLRTWVFGIVRRVASDHRRSRQRRERKLSRVRAHVAQSPSDAGQPVAEARTLALEFLDSIDEEHAAIFVLSQLYGVPLREIATSLELNPNTVASRLRATRSRLKALAGAEERLTNEESPPEGAKARVLAGLGPLLLPPPKPAVLTGFKAAFVGVCIAGGVAVVAGSHGPPEPGPSPDAVFSSGDIGLTGLARLDSTIPTIPEVLPLAPPPPGTRAEPAPRRAQPTPVAAAPLTPAQPPPSPGGDLRAELALVTKARSAVREGKPTLALRTARTYASRFPRGLLQTEMDVVRVDSLCRLGRQDEAFAVVGRLRSAGPQTPKTVCPESELRPGLPSRR